MAELHTLLNQAESVAQKAGECLREEGGELRTVEFLDRRDVKLQADRESEILIRRLLGEIADYPVVGEEQGGDDSLTSRYEPYWVVDPLDGTYNYLRGAPQCAVSIGLMRGETPVLGVIYDFYADACFTGIAGERAWVNGEAVASQRAETIDQAVLATGFPAGMDTSPARLEAFVERVQTFKKIRMIGSAALAMAYVGAGYYDVYYEPGIRLWDVAAGLAILQAAGGTVRMKPARTGKRLAYDVWAAGDARFLPGKE